MKSQWTGFRSPLGPGIEAFLAHRRALGCRLRTEEMALRLLGPFFTEREYRLAGCHHPGGHRCFSGFSASTSATELQSPARNGLPRIRLARRTGSCTSVTCTRNTPASDAITPPVLVGCGRCPAVTAGRGQLAGRGFHTTSSSGLPNYLCVALWLGNA